MPSILTLKRDLKKLTKPKAGILCLDCGQVLLSYTVHDYKTCGCPNDAMVDGGDSYLRYGAMNMKRLQVVNVRPSPVRRKK